MASLIRNSRCRLPVFLEWGLWISGAAALLAFSALTLQKRAGAQEALASFELAVEQRSSLPGGVRNEIGDAIRSADQSLWSPDRIDVFTAEADPAAAIGILRVPSLELNAPVFFGALDEELDRGPGWIRGTSPLGTGGNVGIAGHRDGFFRVLKDIEIGDTIEVVGLEGETTYRVTHTWIVDPDDVFVLDPTDSAALTLVTCYPFYFVGHAPNRFIVRAEAI